MSNTVSISSLKPTPGASDRRVTVSSSALTLNGDSSAPTFNADTKYVVIDVQTNPILVTFDGSTPTATNGHRFVAGDKATWGKATAIAAKMIRESSDGTIHASEFTD